MLVAERHQRILHEIKNRKSVRVSELSKKYGFTEETIRRDLEKLEKEGKLLRTHGGAVPLPDNQGDLTYTERENINVDEKIKIAREAVKYIEENDHIFMDNSSTTLYIAKILPNIPLTIVTSQMKVVFELAKKDKINVINTGGTLSATSLSFVGPITLQSLEQFYANKAFMSCKALDYKWGISDSNDMQAAVTKMMIEKSDQSFLLADHSKIGKRSFSKISDLNQIDYLIVDDKTDPNQIKMIEQLGVKVIVSSSNLKNIT